MKPLYPMHEQLLLLLPWLREEAQGYRFQEISAQEWQALLLAAGAHRVSPLLYARLRADGVLDQLPAEVVYALEQAYALNQARDARRWHALEAALSALVAGGIDVILLKGAALVATVYDRPALRPMDDLDILVSPAQFRAAAQCLCEQGYRPAHAEHFAGALEQVSHHLALTAAAPFTHTIELHHVHLSLPAVLAAAIPFAELLARSDAVTVGAAPARVLHPVDQLLHLAAHLIQHGAAHERLIWYCDLDRLVRQEADRLPWNEVLARAQRCRMILPLRQALGRLVIYLGTPVPPEVLAQAAALPVDLAQRLRYRARPQPISRLADGLQRVAGSGSPAAGARLAWRVVFPDRAYMRATCDGSDPWRLMASYGIRWAGVLRDAAAGRSLLRGR